MGVRAFKQNGPLSKEDQCICVLDCFGFTLVSLSRRCYPLALLGKKHPLALHLHSRRVIARTLGVLWHAL